MRKKRYVVANNQNSVSGEARNALITAIGIVLGFALAYFGSWSSVEEAWVWWDLIPGLPLFGGICALLVSLYRSLIPYNQSIERYEANAKLFVYGVAAAFVGVIISLFM